MIIPIILLFIHYLHWCCLRCLVETFCQTISSWMVGRCDPMFSASQAEELFFKVIDKFSPLISDSDLTATKSNISYNIMIAVTTLL